MFNKLKEIFNFNMSLGDTGEASEKEIETDRQLALRQISGETGATPVSVRTGPKTWRISFFKNNDDDTVN